MALKAIIFVPDAYATAATDRCLDHCRAHRYDVFGVVAGDWNAVAQILRDGAAQVLVLDNRDDLPADALPRFEVVAEAPQHHPGRRRTMPLNRESRIIRRSGGAT